MQYVFIFIAFCMLYSLIKIKLSTCSIILIVAWKVLPRENQNKVLVKGLILIRLHAIIKKKSKVFISKIQSCNVPRITFGNTCLDANKQGIDFHNNLPINYMSIKYLYKFGLIFSKRNLLRCLYSTCPCLFFRLQLHIGCKGNNPT